MRGWGGRRIRRKRRRIPPSQTQVVGRFQIPVSYVRFTVTFLDGTVRPWAYRAVLN